MSSPSASLLPETELRTALAEVEALFAGKGAAESTSDIERPTSDEAGLAEPKSPLNRTGNPAANETSAPRATESAPLSANSSSPGVDDAIAGELAASLAAAEAAITQLRQEHTPESAVSEVAADVRAADEVSCEIPDGAADPAAGNHEIAETTSASEDGESEAGSVAADATETACATEGLADHQPAALQPGFAAQADLVETGDSNIAEPDEDDSAAPAVAPAGSNEPADADGLSAALAEIESMSSDEAAGIPSLDDGSDSAPARPEAPPSEPSGEDDLARALAEIESMSSDEAAGIPSLDDGSESGSAEPEAGDSQASEEDDLAAALAEIESMSGDEAAAIPSLDDGGESEQSAAPPAGKADSPSGDAPKKKIKFKMGKSDEDKAPSSDGSPPDDLASDLDNSADGVLRPVASTWKRVYRIVDAGLESANDPFRSMPKAVRGLVGLLAITMIAVALLSALLIPIVMPNEDAVTFLRERHAQLGQAESSQPHAARPPAADQTPIAASTP